MLYTVKQSDLCPDCTTPAIEVTRTNVIIKLYHDPGCPGEAAYREHLEAQGFRVKEPQR